MGLDFVTADGETAWADVSRQDGSIRLVVSIKSDGDYDVLLAPEVARDLGTQLIAAAEGMN